MSAFLNLNIDNEYALPGIKYNEETGVADIMIPYIDRKLLKPQVGMTANTVAAFDHYEVNVSNGDILSHTTETVGSFAHIDNVTGVYIPEEDLYIARATLQDRAIIKVYDVTTKTILEFSATLDNTHELERYTILLEQHLNQKYGEDSENLGFLFTPKQSNEAGGEIPAALKITWLHDGVAETVIDAAGVKRYLSKVVDPENGLQVDYVGSFDGTSVFWQREMESILFTRYSNKDKQVRLSSIKTGYQNLSLIKGGVLMSKMSKSGKYRYCPVSLDLIKRAIKGDEKSLLAALKKSKQVGVNYNAVNCINSEDVQLVIENDELGKSVRLSKYSTVGGGLVEVGTLPANAMEENFILVKDKYNGIHRIVFKL